jgi:hypothetical protein
MNTVARPKTPVIIEDPARFKPLGCEQIEALFRSGGLFDGVLFDPPGASSDVASSSDPLPDGIFDDLSDVDLDDLDNFDPSDDIGPEPVTTTRALEVRCSAPDCPGRGGWVIENIIGDLTIDYIGHWPILLYVAPRGYKFRRGAFVPTERMKEQRRRGYVARRGYEFAETAGRNSNRGALDVMASELHSRGMPAEAVYLEWRDGFLVRCSSCTAPRFLRVTAEAATAHLPKERCGMVK